MLTIPQQQKARNLSKLEVLLCLGHCLNYKNDATSALMYLENSVMRNKQQKCRESSHNPLKIRLPYQLQLLQQLCGLRIFHQMRGMCLSSFFIDEASSTGYQGRSKERYFMNQQSSSRATFPISDDIQVKVKLKTSWYGLPELSFFVPLGTQSMGLAYVRASRYLTFLERYFFINFAKAEV